MPIKPENLVLYSPEWPQIRKWVLARARDRCECRGECDSEHRGGRCDAPHDATIVRWNGNEASWHIGAGERSIKVVLTIAHLDHDPRNNDPSNLRAMCQRCHLRYDRHHHAETAAETRRQQARDAGQLEIKL